MTFNLRQTINRIGVIWVRILARTSIKKSLLNPALPQRHPKFSIGDEVVWFKTTSRDCGIVIARLWTNSSPSCKTQWGWHYLIKLSPSSTSYGICFKDWGFEEDLMLDQAGRRQSGGKVSPEGRRKKS
jgi:hypothetical protein